MRGDLPVYEPSPNPNYGVIEFVGEFFTYGLACGSAFHLVRALRSSPRGARLAGVVHAVSTHAPQVAGRFGAYCAGFFAVEGGVSLARGMEDGCSVVAGGAILFGLDGMRRGGAPAAVRGALLGVAGTMTLVEIGLNGMALYSKRLMVNRAHPVPISAARRGDPMEMDYDYE